MAENPAKTQKMPKEQKMRTIEGFINALQEAKTLPSHMPSPIPWPMPIKDGDTTPIEKELRKYLDNLIESDCIVAVRIAVS